MSINQRIIKVRNAFKLSQVEFAERLEVKRTHITDVERQKVHFPNQKTLEKIHCEFGINLNWLISGDGKMYEEGSRFSEEQAINVNEPLSNYHPGKTDDPIKDKYIEVLEENRDLRNEIERIKREQKENKANTR